MPEHFIAFNRRGVDLLINLCPFYIGAINLHFICFAGWFLDWGGIIMRLKGLGQLNVGRLWLNDLGTLRSNVIKFACS